MPDKMPEFQEGRDYTLEYKTAKNGREYAVFTVRYGDWRAVADDDYVRIYNGKMQMLGFDVNGFNSLLNVVLKFTEISGYLRDRRNNSMPTGAPAKK